MSWERITAYLVGIGCGAYVDGLGPLLGPMLAVLGRSWDLCWRSWAALGTYVGGLGRSWGLCGRPWGVEGRKVAQTEREQCNTRAGCPRPTAEILKLIPRKNP